MQDLIAQDLPVTYVDNRHVTIGDRLHPCTGPRIHVSTTGLIENFHLLNHFIYDRFTNKYLLVGCVGKDAEKNLQKLDEQQEKHPTMLF